VVVEGVSVAREILRGPFQVLHALASPRLAAHPEAPDLLDALERLGNRARGVDDRTFSSISDVESSQGILLIINRPRWDLEVVLASTPAQLVLVAHGVQDPGNVGALARIAEGAWATALICIGGADPWSPKAVRASAGSIPRLPVVESKHAPAILRRLAAAGLRLVGTTPHDAPSYRDAELDGPMAFIVGSEGDGLPRRIEQLLDLMVSIPMKEGVESLNVASAAAVILFHRRPPEPA
jgi:TrmH family RNA methyltransferase